MPSVPEKEAHPVDADTEKNIEILLTRYFPQLSDQRLRDEIRDQGSIVLYRPGEDILDYGKYVKMVPLVASGRIKVMRADDRGREIFLYTLQPGETCTMTFSCCMASKRSEVRTVAEEETTVIALPIEYVDRWMTTYPVWKNFVMRAYDERMVELIKTIDNIAFKKMDERLWEYLERKAALSPDHEVHTTHQEIANDLFASREAISRLLKKLEHDGAIALSRNTIRIIH